MQEVIFTRRTTADHAIIYTNTPLKVMLDVTTRMVKNTIQYNTIQYNTIQYNTIQYNAMQCNTIQYNTGGTWVQGRGIVILCKYIYILYGRKVYKASLRGYSKRITRLKAKLCDLCSQILLVLSYFVYININT